MTISLSVFTPRSSAGEKRLFRITLSWSVALARTGESFPISATLKYSRLWEVILILEKLNNPGPISGNFQPGLDLQSVRTVEREEEVEVSHCSTGGCLTWTFFRDCEEVVVFSDAHAPDGLGRCSGSEVIILQVDERSFYFHSTPLAVRQVQNLTLLEVDHFKILQPLSGEEGSSLARSQYPGSPAWYRHARLGIISGQVREFLHQRRRPAESKFLALPFIKEFAMSSGKMSSTGDVLTTV